MVNKIEKHNPASVLGGQAVKVKTMNPITKEPMEVTLEPVKEYGTDQVKRDLDKYGLEPIKEVEVVDPITNKRSIVTIDRTGTHEGKLILALANPDLTRDQKDFTLSMYLFERGKENASMMVDLYRYKGEHTKETRAFTSQMRFDFEMFISLFCEQMRAIARDIAKSYSIEDVKSFCDEYMKVLKDNSELRLYPYLIQAYPDFQWSVADSVHIMTMIRNWTEAERFEYKQDQLKVARQREKGFGIYIDAKGQPYSIFKDEDIVDIVQADKERLQEITKEENERN